MIEYKILHIPTGYYIYDQLIIPSPRRAKELLHGWLECFDDVYDTRGCEEENNYEISIGSPEMYLEYRTKFKIPLKQEFEIMVVQS